MRLSQRTVPLLQLGKQPDVFNRDHRLVGESLQQLDLRVAEWYRLHSYDVDGADRYIAAHHGDGQARTIAQRPSPLGAVRVLAVVLSIGHRDDAAFKKRAAGNGASSRWCRIGASDDRRRLCRPTIVSGNRDDLTVVAKDHAVDAIAQSRGARGDRVEDRLQICWRATDHAQNLAGGGPLLQRLTNLRMCLRQRPVLLL